MFPYPNKSRREEDKRIRREEKEAWPLATLLNARSAQLLLIFCSSSLLRFFLQKVPLREDVRLDSPEPAYTEPGSFPYLSERMSSQTFPDEQAQELNIVSVPLREDVFSDKAMSVRSGLTLCFRTSQRGCLLRLWHLKTIS
jgi:hypothetical protein